MYKLEVRHHFDAAHFLPGHEGKCSQLHGHRWQVVVKYTLKSLTGPVDMLVDFGDIKDVIDKFDHTSINVLIGYPSAEQIAHHLWRHMPIIPKHRTFIEVEVWESPNCIVSYAGYRSVGRDYFQAHDMTGTPDLPGEKVDVEGIYERMYAERGESDVHIDVP